VFRFFHSNNPICIILLVPFVLVLHLPIFMLPLTGPMDTDGYLSLLAKPILAASPALHYLVSAILVCIDLYLVHKITNIYKMLGSYSYLVTILFCFLNAFFISFTTNISTQVAVLLLLMLVYYYILLFERSFSLKTGFNIGLVLGLGGLFFKPFMLFFVLSVWGVIAYRTDYVRVFFAILLGFLMPFYFLFTIQYLGASKIIWFSFLPQVHLLSFEKWAMPPIGYLYAVLFVGFFVQSFIKSQGSLNSMLIFNRNIYNALSLSAALVVISLFLSSFFSLSLLHLMVIPFSFMLAYLLKDYKRKWIPELYFWILLCLVIFNSFLFRI
jgi:hypothetical protein